MTLLEVERLRIDVNHIAAVKGLSFSVERGERVGLVGESGSGKTLSALAIMGLLPVNAVASGSVWHDSVDLLTMPDAALGALRGRRISMVFQDALAALNPVMRVGAQIAEVLRIHEGVSRSVARVRAVDLLARVRIADPERKARAYPHELSGGQRQRVMIAMAIACKPDLVIADEPTSALDVTVQAEIVALLKQLVDEEGSALLLITHDLPLVSHFCDRVIVLYGGKIVETGPTAEVMRDPGHPYTVGLLQAVPRPVMQRSPSVRLLAIPGNVPALGRFPSGCPFRDRCDRATSECATEPTPTVAGRREYACWHPTAVASLQASS